MKATPFTDIVDPHPYKIKERLGRGGYGSVSGPLNKYLDGLNGDVVSGPRALAKQK